MVKRILSEGAGEAEVLSISIDGPKVEIPDAHLLFTGQFSRSGSDLVIVGEDGQTIIIVGYFSAEEPPILTADGAWLTSDVVEALAGPLAPGQYAQAGTTDVATGGSAPIGQVETLSGKATVTRTDGTVVELKIGDKVFKGDVVATEDGASLGIVFLDETVFTLSSGSRMVLNDLVYQPGGNDNSMLMNLVQGTFVFVAGKVAPSGDMKIETPVATMGIRGTTGIINITLEDGSAEISRAATPEVTFKIAPDPGDGKVGSYELFDKATGALLGTVEDTGTKLIITEVGGTPTEVARTPEDLFQDQAALNAVYNAFSSAQQRIQSGDNPVSDNGPAQTDDGADDDGTTDDDTTDDGTTDDGTTDDDITDDGTTDDDTTDDDTTDDGTTDDGTTDDDTTDDGTTDDGAPDDTGSVGGPGNEGPGDGAATTPGNTGSLLNAANTATLNSGGLDSSSDSGTDTGGGPTPNPATGGGDSTNSNAPTEPEPQPEPPVVDPIPPEPEPEPAPPVIDLDGDDSGGTAGNNFAGSFVEGGGPVSIADTDVTITDADDTTIESATITLVNQPDGGDEGLSVSGTLPSGITAAGSGTGELVLSGSASLAEYQATIAQVQYNNTSSPPDPTDRTITVVVNDGEAESTATSTIIFNDPPTLDLDDDNSSNATGADFNGSFTEGGGPVSIADTDVTITDADDTNIESATITLTNRPNGADESLSVSGSLPTGITASAYNPGTGELVLTGSATLADYQAVIAQIQYNNTSANPTTAARTIEVVVNDGDDDSNAATSTISVNALNDEPALDLDADNSTETGADFAGSFVEGGGPISIADTDVAITDPDDTNIESATITLTNRPDGGDESLSVSGSLPTGITAAAYVPATGVLVLTGSASLADYQTAIAQIQYNNTNANPTTAARTITVVVNDGDDDSNIATSTISISSANDAPALDLDVGDDTAAGTAFAGTFVEDGGPVDISDGVLITDADDTTIESATITLTNPLDGGDEGLSVNGSLPTGIAAAGSGTGEIVLTGSASLADYQAAIAQIQYDNTSADPDTTDRTIEVVVNDGDDDSNTATATISVGALNDEPALDLDANDSSTASGTDFAGSFVEGGGPVSIADTDVAITDVDDTNIESATIILTNRPDGGDESLSVSGSLPTGITEVAYVPATGVLVLTGSATLADYQAAIAQIQYDNASADPDGGDRTITVVVNDGDDDSNIATSTIGISSANDAPALDLDVGDDTAVGTAFAGSFFEDGGPVDISDGVLITDADDSNIESATITLTNQLDGGSEGLSVNGSLPTGIVATGSGTGEIVLTGSASLADYQTAIAQIQYNNTSANPDAAARTITVVVNDGDDDSNTATATISVSVLNDAPDLDLDANDSSTATGADFTGSFTEGGGPISIADADVAVTDVDDTNIESATITLINRPDGGDESLSVSGSLPTGITEVAYVPATGVLVLTGSATLADYQTAIAQIQYDNASADPDTTDRTIEVVVNDGDDDSNLATATISVSALNDAPDLDLDADNSTATGADFTGSFTEGGGPVSIADADVAIADADDTTIESATITLTNQLDGGSEGLSVNGSLPTGIVAAGSGTGQIVLTGSASLADYQAAIAQIQYDNASADPTTAARTITVVVNDGDDDSNIATSTISVGAANDTPALDLDVGDDTAAGTAFAGTFVEDGGPVDISDGVLITDADDTDIESATITLTNRPDGGDESLSVNGSLPTGITASAYNPATGELVLTGSATLADYQTAIAQIQYDNANSDPDTADRTIEVVVNDGDDDSNTATATISVGALNDAPDLDLDANDSSTATGADFTGSFTEGGGPVSIADADVAITDVDDTNIESATITLTNRPDGGDESLSVSGSLPTGITEVAYVPATGVLVLTGSATLADYQAAIAQIQYDNANTNPTTTARTITVVVNDGDADSNIATSTISVGAANDAPTLDLDVGDETAAGTAFAGSFFEDGGPVDISDGVLIADADDTNIESATITLTNIADGIAESLSVNGLLPTGITTTGYNSGSGEIVLTGSASLADYQTAIAQIQYNNTSQGPDTADRIINVVVNDGDGNSNTAVATVSIIDEFDPPVVDNLDGDSLAYDEGDGPLLLDQGALATVTDVDSPNFDTGLLRARITVGEGTSEDLLSVDTSGPVALSGTTAGSTVSVGGIVIGTLNVEISEGNDFSVFLNADATPALVQTLVQALTYENTDTDDPTTGARTIEVSVRDNSDGTPVTADVTVTVAALNDAPSLDLDANDSSTATGADFTGSFSEGSGPVSIADADVAITDVDDTDIESATITLTNRPDGGDESLSVSGSLPTGITAAAYNPANGELVLTGSATLADYQAAIAQIQYDNASANPDGSDRTITVVVNDGDDDSNVATSTISVGAANDAPALDLDVGDDTAAGTAFAGTFVEDGGLVDISDGVLITDADDTNIESATITLTNRPDGVFESLSVSGSLPSGITASAYSPTTGILTLNGSASLADYQTAIGQIRYNNSDQQPDTANRIITVVVNDGDDDSNVATATITVDAENDLPIIDLDFNNDSGAGGPDFLTSFTEGGGAVSVADTDFAIVDVDDTNLDSARITLINRPDGGDESLSVNGSLPSGITASAYDPGTGVIILTGSASLSDYQTAIRQIEYNNTSLNPDTADRTIEVTVNDGDDGDSNVATTTVIFTASNDAPVLDLDADGDSGAVGADFLGSFTEDLGPVAIGDIVDPDITITDADSATLVSATITLTNRPDGDAIESLSVNGSLPSGISTAGYSAATGQLVLTGTASLADYQTAIGQIRYNNSSQDPAPADRTIEVVVNDGVDDSNTAIATISVNPTVDAPAVSDLDGDSFTYNEGDGAQIIDRGTAASVVDVDSADFNGGNLTVAIVSGGDTTEDVLAIQNQGTGTGQISVSGLTVSFEGDVIGSFVGGANGANLVVTFTTTDATPAAAQALVQAITYANTDTDNPDDANDRVVRFNVNDGDGGTSPNADVTITVAPQNDAPTIDFLNQTRAYNEGQGALIIDNLTPATLTDVDSTDFDGGNVTATISAGGDAAEDLLSVDTGGSVALGGTTAGSDVSIGGTVIGTLANNIAEGNDFVVNLNASATAANVQTLLQALTYENTAVDNPTGGNRTIDVTVNDGDGGTSAAATSTVNVLVSNDPPVLNDLAGDTLAYNEGDLFQIIDQGALATVVDPDSGDFDTGVLTVSITNRVSTEDIVSLSTSGTGVFLSAGVTLNSEVTVAGQVIGTIGSGGALNQNLVVTFNANADATDVQTVINAVTYLNSNNINPDETARTVRFFLTDGDGGSTGNVDTIVNITGVDDFTNLNGISGDTLVYNEGDGAQTIDQGTPITISDGDSPDFNGGFLQIQIVSGGDSAEDLLGILAVGDGTGEINVSGSTVTYEGDTIGTIQAGPNNVVLRVDFTTADATQEAVQALARQFTYTNTDTDNPTIGDRTVRFFVDDGDGGTATSSDATVTVNAVNDAPTLTATGAILNWTETTAAPLLFSGTSISTVEAGETIIGFTFTITNVVDGGGDILFIGGNNVFLNDGNSIGAGGFTADVSFSSTTATVTLSGGNLTVAAAEAFIDAARWQNNSDNPTAIGNTTRDITITEIIDSGGVANGGVDASNPGISTTINLTPTNDPTTADLPRAASFGGTTSDFVIANPVDGSLPAGDFTVSLWINDPTTEQTEETYLSYEAAGAANEFVIAKGTGNLAFSINGTANFISTAPIPTDGDWHHFAITFNATTGAYEVFVDGVSVDTGTTTAGGLAAGGSLVLGQDQDSPGGGFQAFQALTGSVADVAFFGSQLSAGAIDDISNGTVNPTAANIFLRWNDDTNSFDDVSGGSNDPTTNGNVTTDTGPVATVTEDGTIVISGIEVFDPDNTSTTVTLSVGNGEISFTGGTTNLTFSDGDGTDGTLTFSGSITAINAALANSIQYSPDADFDGTDTLTITADDGGGAGPALNLTIPVIPVNDDPVAVADVAEATAISLPSLNADIDALIVNDFNASGGAGPDRTQLLTNDGSGGLTASDVGTPDVRGNDVKLGDFDGDGDLDAIVALSNGQDQLLTNQGGAQAGTEGTFVASNLPGGVQQSIGLAVGDVDSDGDLDVIVTHFNNPNPGGSTVEATLLTNDGSANFTASQLTGTSIQGRDAALTDLDGDGDLDAIVVNDASANQLLINQGGTQGGTEGAFNASTLTGGVRFSVDVVFGDIDGDGDQDALIGNTVGLSQVLTNSGSGVFTVTDLTVAGDRQTTAIALGDLDNDGDLDAVIANGTSGEQANQVLINQGGNQGGPEGVFTAADITGSDGRSSDVTLVDIDGDGDLDAFITNNAFNNALDQTNQVLINDGTGTFTPSLLDGGNSASNAIAFGDLDGDGAVAAVGPDGLPNINLSPVRGSVATNDSDVDSASLTYTLDAPVDGLTLATDGSFVFDPTDLAYASLAAGQATNVVASYTVDDGDGGTDQSTLTITVTGTDDAPTFTAAAASPTFTEGGTAQALFSASAASTVDTGQTFTGFTLTVTDVSGTADDRLTVNGFEFSLTDSNTNTPGPNGLGFTVSVDNGTAIVVFSGGAVPAASFETLINGITYANFSDDPTASSATRVVTLTEVVDSGSSDGFNQNTTAPNIASTVTIAPVNDPPDLDLDLNNSSGATGADFNNTFTEGGGSVAIGDGAESDLNISLFDDVNIESATITLTIRPDGADEFLLVSGGLPGGIVASAYNQSTGVITLTGTASKADYEGALEQIRYNNTSSSPDTADRIITVVVNDGTDDSNTATATISINGVNDAPVANLDEFSAKMGDTVTGNLITANNGHGPDSDQDGNPVTMFITGRYNSDNGGSVLLNADGSFVYEAPTGFVGLDTFAYAIEDGQGGFDVGYAAIQLSKDPTDPIVRNGAAADDLLRGGDGSDTLSGFAGDDILRAVTAEQSRTATGDQLDGGADDDTLWTRGGRSTLVGGTGNDNFVSRDDGLFYDFATVDYSSSTGGVTVNLTSSTQSGVLSNQADDGVSGTDFLHGIHAVTDSAQNDSFFADGSFLNSRGGALQFNLGTGGNDTVDFTGSSNAVRRVSFQNLGGANGVVANLSTGTATVNAVAIATFLNFGQATESVNQLFGSANADTLTGDANDNLLRGSAGVDSLDGGAGTGDTADFRDGTQAAFVDLSLGASQVSDDGFGNVESLIGIENLFGSAFDDSFAGDSGDNTFVGFAGNDTLFGGDGEDILRGDFEDPDFLDGGFGGNDFLDGGFGGNDFLDGANDDDELFGGAGDDILLGGAGDDWLWGGSGNDRLEGGPGDDVLLSGGSPHNFPSVWTAEDELFGGDGNDILFGQGGPALLRGDAGDDIIRGDGNGGWNDWVRVTYDTSNTGIIANLTNSIQSGLNPGEVSDGLGGTDSVSRVHVIGDSDHDDQIFWDGNFAGSFGDFIEVRLGAGDDTVDFTGATGQRRVSYEDADGGVFIDMTANATNGSGTATENGIGNHIGTDTIINANYLRGSKFDDVLIGDAQTTRYRPSEGNDTVTGATGVVNRLNFNNSPDGVTIDLSLGSGQVVDDGFGTSDTITNFSRFDGTSFDDTIAGDASDTVTNLRIDGNEGNDTLTGGGGNDTIFGDFGDVINRASDGAGVQIPEGDASLLADKNGVLLVGGDDVIRGGGGDDNLFGGQGVDTLTGDDGIDTIDGGDDRQFGVRQFYDTVDYSKETGSNGVTVDFSSASNNATDTFGNTETVINVERVIGTDQADTLTGGNIDNDEYEEFIGGGGNDTIDGGTGFDRVSYELAAGGVTVDMTLTTNQVTDDGDGGVDDLSNIESIEGSEFGDTITAPSTGFFVIRGRGGDDVIIGNGVDTRADYHWASATTGATVNLSTLAITSLVTGNSVAAGRAEDGIEVTPGVLGLDTLSGITQIRGTRLDDHLVGGAADEVFIGTGGDDTINGGGGTANTIDYSGSIFLSNHQTEFDVNRKGDSGVQVNLTTNSAIDAFGDTDTLTNIQNVVGTQFADTIIGGAENNVFVAGGNEQRFDADNDIIVGGAGDDIMSTSGGYVIFRGDQGNDTITSTDPGGDFDWVQVDYITSPGAINVTNGVGSTLSVSDGFGTTDTISGAHVIRDSRNSDIFNIDAGAYTNSFGNFLEIRLSEGDDVVNFTNVTGTTRISWQAARGGVLVDLTTDATEGSGSATDNIAGANFIGSDTFSGVNYVRGSSFDDAFIGDGFDNIFRGSRGNDSIDGAGGVDRIDHSDSGAGINVDLSQNLVIDDGFGTTDTLTSIENVRGSFFDDRIVGDSNANDLRGGDGDDEIFGRAGDDFLRGQSGDDVIDGGDGDDDIDGGDGNDIMRGGDGLDFFTAGAGNDIYQGGDDIDPNVNVRQNFDFIDFSNVGGPIFVDLEERFIDDDGQGGEDIITGIEVVQGTASADTLIGGNVFNDDFEDFRGGAGNDFIDGGSGFDRVRYQSASNGVTVNLSDTTQLGVLSGQADDGDGGTDTLVSIESLVGSNLGDQLFGNSNSFTQFRPRFGDDTITGGTSGSDEVDYAFSGLDVDGVTVNLGTGFATFTDVSNSGTNAFTDSLFGIERIRGSFGNDTLIGDANNNRFRGLEGNDTIQGGGGFDTADYSSELGLFNDGGPFATNGILVNFTGSDQFGFFSNAGLVSADSIQDGYGTIDSVTDIDRVVGTIFSDDFYGSGADETFDGGDGYDYFRGNGGNDTIIGGDDFDRDLFNLTGIEQRTTFDMVDYRNSTTGVNVNLATGAVSDDGLGGSDTISGIEVVRGSDNADILTGGNTDNDDFEQFRPRGGNDTVDGGSGFDRLSYQSAGNSVTINLTTAAVVSVIAGHGTVAAGTAIDGFGGTDTVSNFESIRGSNNADHLIGNSTTFTQIRGMKGDDRIEGGTSTEDEVDYAFSGLRFDGVTVDLAAGTGTFTDLDGDGDGADDSFVDTLIGIEKIRGTFGDDTLIGDAGDNSFRGIAGDDTINGGVSNASEVAGDTVNYGSDFAISAASGTGLFGISGVRVNLGTSSTFGIAPGTAVDGFGDTDTLTNIENVIGTIFSDTIVGSSAANTLVGGDGSDTLVGGAGDDTLVGGDDFDPVLGIRSYFDIVDYSAETGGSGVTVDLSLNTATDTFGDTDTLSGIEVVIGTAGNDFLTGGNAANDDFELFRALGGNNTIDGGSGFDRVRYTDSPTGVEVDLANGDAQNGFGGTDVLISIESVQGSFFDDDLFGDANNNQFRPMQGNDVINGAGGIDQIDYAFTGGTQGIEIDLHSAVATDTFGDTDYLINIENVRGSFLDDTITGDDLNNAIRPLAGNDVIDGAGGIDMIDYSSDFSLSADNPEFVADKGVVVDLELGFAVDGYDNVDLVSNIENVRGTQFTDLIFGDEEDNLLEGLDGDDIIWGGNGNDIIDGGAGADIFEYEAGDTGVDTILNFESANDKFDLSDLLDANFPTAAPGDHVRAVQSGTDTIVEVDADGTDNGVNFTQIATLDGVGPGTTVSFIIDDADTTSSVVSS